MFYQEPKLCSFFPRFYYYQGRIKATQLDYSEAHKYLVQSARKAPQNSANGFKQHVTKLSITVELLLGNIPERQVFLQKDVSHVIILPTFYFIYTSCLLS